MRQAQALREARAGLDVEIRRLQLKRMARRLEDDLEHGELEALDAAEDELYALAFILTLPIASIVADPSNPKP